MSIQLICNKFGGIRRKNASFTADLISASDLQNVELYNTGINGGVGIRTAKGNVTISSKLPAGEKIINIFKSVQKKTNYFFVHSTSDTQGKIYLYDVLTDTLTLKKKGLTATRESCGVDFAQGYSDLFVFANGIEFLTIEIGAKDTDGNLAEVVMIDKKDQVNKTVKGLAMAVRDGRVWLADGNILRYCVQANIYDWATSDIEVTTSAGYIEFTKDITAIFTYLTTLAVFFKDSSIQIKGTYPFSQDEESPGGCAGYDALIFHDTDLFFFDNTKKGIFSFKQVINGEKTLGTNIGIEIQEELLNVDASKLNEIKTLSVVLSDRNEIWWLFPISDENYSMILIYDYLKGEWLKRKSQKINCFNIIDGILYSGAENGKILQEYKSNTFDGEYIQHYYNCSPMNLGSNTTQKVLYFPPRVAFDLPYINNFFVKYVKNFNTFKTPKIKEIKAKFKNFLIWGVGIWGVNYWASKTTNAMGKFPSVTFKILEIQIYTANENQNFAIKNMEFSQIEVIQL